MRDVPCQVCQIYINNRYFTYIITYLYNPQPYSRLGFRHLRHPVADDRGRWHGHFRPKIKNGGIPTFSGGTGPARRWHGRVWGLSEVPWEVPHAGGTPVPGPRRSRTAPDGSGGFPGRRRVQGATRRPGGPRKGLLWPLMGLLRSPQWSTARGRPSAISGPWGPRVASRRFPAISDNKTGEVMSEILGRLLTQNF